MKFQLKIPLSMCLIVSACASTSGELDLPITPVVSSKLEKQQPGYLSFESLPSPNSLYPVENTAILPKTIPLFVSAEIPVLKEQSASLQSRVSPSTMRQASEDVHAKNQVSAIFTEPFAVSEKTKPIEEFQLIEFDQSQQHSGWYPRKRKQVNDVLTNLIQ